MRLDKVLVDSSGNEVMSSSGSPITLLGNGAPITINRDGTIFQGDASLGKLSVQKFANLNQLQAIAGGYFSAPQGVEPEEVEDAELLQGYLEGSNASPLREMVDLVLISRAYEANQKIINTVDQQMQKTLDALG
jgi:flagellar basal-body rod protein FlgF